MIGLEGEDQNKAKYRICMGAAVNVPSSISHQQFPSLDDGPIFDAQISI
jgi:hypothetical protein